MKYLTPKQAAEIIGVGQDHIVHLIHSEVLAASNVSLGKKRPRWKISEDDIVAFMERRQKKSPPKRRPRRKLREVPQYV
ncbi:MAG: helix-turn-helix domain-containing protein [Planctomycetota bacterium]